MLHYQGTLGLGFYGCDGWLAGWLDGGRYGWMDVNLPQIQDTSVDNAFLSRQSWDHRLFRNMKSINGSTFLQRRIVSFTMLQLVVYEPRKATDC